MDVRESSQWLSSCSSEAVVRELAKEWPNERTLTTPEPVAVSIVVVSTFSAEPITVPVKFWMDSLRVTADIRLAPYGQVMQELLNPTSLTNRNDGVNILLLRMEDWIRGASIREQMSEKIGCVRRNVEEILAAIRQSREHSSAPLLTFVCPSSSGLPLELSQCLSEAGKDLAGGIAGITGVSCYVHAELVQLYPVANYEDKQSDRIGHIPYTPEYFASTATLLARRIASLVLPQRKVIVIDCDDTLWRGICGEGRSADVELTPGHLQLHDMLQRQHEFGVLLCLCSKNNLSDVEATFTARPEMGVRKESFVAQRVNWQSKSENLRSLASELNLGLESFIFIDDSPVECAEIRATCPSVLTLQFPRDPSQIASFLNHVWAFDRTNATKEGKQRTALYRQNQLRESALLDAPSLRDFVASLDLQVRMEEMQPGHLDRVAELIQRTNQFNLTNKRRRSAEIRRLVETGALSCHVVHVSDRFGDYGLVGVVMLKVTERALEVDTFVLSCRVLGRGTEQRIMNELGRAAKSRGLQHVMVGIVVTERNAPAREFFDSAFSEFITRGLAEGGDTEKIFIVPAACAENLQMSVQSSGPNPKFNENRRLSGTVAVNGDARRYEATYELSRQGNFLSRIYGHTGSTADHGSEFTRLKTRVEAKITAIWEETLGRRGIGGQEDFFALGGDSILAVRVLAKISAAFDVDLSLADLFEGPTVGEVALRTLRLLDVSDHNVSAPGSVPLTRSIGNEVSTGTGELLRQVHIEHIARCIPGGSENIESIYPLSPAQREILFSSRATEGEWDPYVISVLLSISSPSQVQNFSKALQGVIDQNAILRTAVLWDQLPTEMQVVCRRATLPVTEEKLDPCRDCITQIKERMKPELQTFDLHSAPPVRLRMFTDPHSIGLYVLLQIHHLVCDHITLDLIAARTRENLNGTGDAVQNPKPYWANLVQHRSRYQPDELIEFLRRKLGTVEEPSAPFGLLRPHGASWRSAEACEQLHPTLARRIRRVAQVYRVPSATLFHLAWALVVARTTGRGDVTFGTVMRGRDSGKIGNQDALGLFIHTLPLRVRLEHRTAAELVNVVQSELTELVSYEAATVSMAQSCSGIVGTAPLFTSLLNYRRSEQGVGTEWNRIPGVRQVARRTCTNYPISVAVDDLSDEFLVAAQTDSRLDPDRVLGYVRQALTSLTSALENEPRARAEDLQIVPEAELRQIVASFNSTGSSVRNTVIHGLFEEQASSVPHAVAVVYKERTISYGELNRRANMLAGYLVAMGIGTEDRVALCVERSPELLVCMLGVLKAGGAYVPLDPANPAERIRHILIDAAPKVLLSQKSLVTVLPNVSEVITILVDAEWAVIDGYGDSELDWSKLRMSADNLAYVIYTSGSTGTPKGVMIQHKNIVNYSVYAAARFDVARGGGAVIASSISFDLVLTSIYPALICGRPLYLCSEVEGIPDLASEVLRNYHLAPVKITPSHLGLLDQELRRNRLDNRINVLVLGGERLQSNVLDQWRDHASGTRIFNHYGPTEATVGCIVLEVSQEESGVVPIGSPIANMRAYILDRKLHPVPLGVVGEIYVSGAGIGRGYLNRPELTADRFLADPFSGEPSGRIYRTGDLGRWRPDGVVEYIGRNDNQVKVRGFRIELGEIEAQLLCHPLVKEAVAVIDEECQEGGGVVAYVTLNSERSTNDGGRDCPIDELRSHAGTRLPEYMLPTAYVVLTALPTTANGKLDRAKLPKPVAVSRGHLGGEAPRGPMEESLALIWQELLRVDQVRRQDNFFELGGDSLLGMRLVGKIAEAFSIEIPLLAFFHYPCFKDMAEFAEQLLSRGRITTSTQNFLDEGAI